MSRLIVYGNCPSCTALKQVLTKNLIKYDVSDDITKASVESGLMLMPIIYDKKRKKYFGASQIIVNLSKFKT